MYLMSQNSVACTTGGLEAEAQMLVLRVEASDLQEDAYISLINNPHVFAATSPQRKKIWSEGVPQISVPLIRVIK